MFGRNDGDRLEGRAGRRWRVVAALALLITFASACGDTKPEQIAYGSDVCAFCRMQISDPRFSAVLVTRKGRTLKFDSIECLVAYYKQELVASGAAAVWVSDYRHAGQMIEATNARFADLGAGHAPMGRAHGWVAVPTASDAVLAGISDTMALRRWSDLR